MIPGLPLPILHTAKTGRWEGLGTKLGIRNVEVCEDIAIVYRNQMAAECRLLSFVIILTISFFCIALFGR